MRKTLTFLMKKSKFSTTNLIAGAVIVLNFIFFTGCKKSAAIEDVIKPADNICPIVELNGNAEIWLNVDGIFIDPGATATDNVDGNITNKIQRFGSLNTQIPGRYQYYYDVRDQANNLGEQVRTIHVGDDTTGLPPSLHAEFLYGDYLRSSAYPLDAPGDSLGKIFPAQIYYNNQLNNVIVLQGFFGDHALLLKNSTSDGIFWYNGSFDTRKYQWVINGSCQLNISTHVLYVSFSTGWYSTDNELVGNLNYYEEQYTKI